KLAELTRTVELARAGSRDAALAMVRSDEGKELMDDIRAFVGEQTRAQQLRVAHLRDMQQQALDASVRTSWLVRVWARWRLLWLFYIGRGVSGRGGGGGNRLPSLCAASAMP